MAPSPSGYGDDTAKEIDREVSRLITKTYERVKSTLQGKKDKPDIVAKALPGRRSWKASN